MYGTHRNYAITNQANSKQSQTLHPDDSHDQQLYYINEEVSKPNTG